MTCYAKIQDAQEFVAAFQELRASQPEKKQQAAYIQNKYPLHARRSEKALVNMYLIKNRSARDIAEDYGVAVTSIQRLLRRHGIKKVGMK